MDYFGLDIGHSTIRLVQISKDSKGLYKLVSLGEIRNPVLNWMAAGTKGIDAMSSAIKLLLSDLKINLKAAAIALPEEEVISRLLTLPPLKDSEIQDALLFEAETFVPYPLDKVSISYEIISRDEQSRPTVFVVAARNELVSKYVDLCKACGISPLAFESPSLAYRTLVSHLFPEKNKPILVVDLGEQYTDITIVRDASVLMTRTLSVGGSTATRAISVGLGLEEASAEEYKKAYGLRDDQLEGKIKKALMPIFSSITEEIRKATVAYKEQFSQNVEFILLSGGGANLPGFGESLTKLLGIEVQAIEPFTKIETSGLNLPINLKTMGCNYALAAGLALREQV